MRNGNWKWWIATSLVAMLAACSGETKDPGNTLPQIDPSEPQPVPTLGQNDFVSADGQNGEASQDNRNAGADGTNNAAAPSDQEADAGAAADDNRTVEEGDIYRVMSDSGLILNLNSYRGLQIIDFSDPDKPEILGSVQVSGTPVEMYSVGDRVYMLMNNWRGYWGSRDDVQVNTFEGGLVMAVDVSDPSDPKVTGRAKIPGWIRKSRLTRGGGDEALFVVANDWSTNETYVKSWSVSSGGRLAEKSRIDLGGSVSEIQASPELLMVARWDWSQQQQGSTISLIDISSPTGTMVEGDEFRVAGRIAKKTNMNHRGDILRVVSGNSWSSNTNTNHVQTFDVSDIQNATPIDDETFGDGEDLYATLFLDNKAFFVTYRRVDPFHSFAIDDAGQIEEKSEFVVSGWNDWFKPVAQQRRLVGIGKNDQNGSTLAVSLYDIEDLTNPDPLVAREELDLSWAWSEANWDDRAFSVLEKGTNVNAPNGDLETGLVLLPFSGWDDANDKYVSGVQIFTFSDSTLTKRGLMYQDTQVRRSFVADRDENTTGNLSESELSLFDTTDPDQPLERSRLELAPNYSDFLVFGDYGVRRHDDSAYYGWWGSRGNTMPTDTLQIVSLAGDVDKADPVAEVTVPTNALVYQVGDLLVSVASEYLSQQSNQQPKFETTIDVWDLSSPTQPTHKGSLVTQDLPGQNYYGNYYGRPGVAEGDVAVAGSAYYPYGYGSPTVKVIDDGLVFVEREGQQELEGHEVITNTYPVDSLSQWGAGCYDQQSYEPKACTFVAGNESCRQLTRADGTVEDEVCTGSFQKCTQTDDGETDCQDYDPQASELQTNTWDRDRYRYWTSLDIHSVDVSQPANPKVGNTIHTPDSNESVGVIARGENVYYTYKRPYRVPGDSRPYVKYFFKKFDYSNVAAPSRTAEVNIPGELIEVDGDTIVTRDFLWGQNIIETSINKLEVSNGRAYLKGVNRFTDREVHGVQLDGAGHVLVTHQTSWLVNYNDHGYRSYEDWDRTVTLAILDLNSANFRNLGEVDVDDWASLKAAVNGKALFTVPGGMLVVNVSDATNPHAQAYFPLRGWPRDLDVDGDTVYFAAGPFGLYTFDADTYNLQQQAP